MEYDVDILNQAIHFLLDGQELKAAKILRTCNIFDFDIVDSLMDGDKQLEGILIELGCPRSSYDILIDSTNPITQYIKNAIDAVDKALMNYNDSLKKEYIKGLTAIVKRTPVHFKDGGRLRNSWTLSESSPVGIDMSVSISTSGLWV